VNALATVPNAIRRFLEQLSMPARRLQAFVITGKVFSDLVHRLELLLAGHRLQAQLH
jgi:hypothetical protein